MGRRMQQLLRATIGVAICSTALSVQAALIFDRLPRGHTIEVIRNGQIVSAVPVPSGATLQVEADSVDRAKENMPTFHGKVRANVKVENETVFSILADEVRVLISK